MAFRYLDDDAAAGCVDDSPASSFAARVMAGNFRAIHDERLPIGGWSVPSGKAQRICSPWPVAIAAALIRLPRGERYEEIELEVEYNMIDFDGESAGTDAVDVYATCMQPDSGMYDPPPTLAEVRDGLGVADPEWTTLTKTASAGSTVLSARVPGSVTGPWVQVLLWVRSRIAASSESTYNIDGRHTLSGFQISKSTGGTDLSGTLPERAVQFIANDSGNQTQMGAGRFMIGYYYDGGMLGGDESVWIYPFVPIGTPLSSTAYLDVYPLGVLELTGISCEPVAPTIYPAPGPVAFATDAPMSQTFLQLSEATDSLLRRRQPQAGVWSGLSSVDTLWPLYGTDSAAVYAKLHHEDWTPIRVWLVDEETAMHPTKDIGGWSVAWLSCVVNSDATAVAGYETLIEYRVSAYSTAAITPGVSSPITTASGTVQIVHASVGAPWDADSPMMAHTLWGIYEFEEWQGAGQLMPYISGGRNGRDPGRHDVRTLAYGEARMDEGGTYPMYIALEARTPTRYSILLALVAAGCARGDEVRT